MDIETAKYIVDFYSILLPRELQLAIHHTQSLFFYKSYKSMSSITEIYRKFEWISTGEEAGLMEDGEDSFLINVAQRIMSQYVDKVFLNYCTKCNQLARTPFAKQCRHCGFDWH